MNLTLIGCRFVGATGEGKWSLVYDATMPSGMAGIITRSYEFCDRDVMSDTYHASPQIAEELRLILADHKNKEDIWEDHFAWPDEEQEESLAYDTADLGSLVLIARH
jgi:hypothetical protein